MWLMFTPKSQLHNGPSSLWQIYSVLDIEDQFSKARCPITLIILTTAVHIMWVERFALSLVCDHKSFLLIPSLVQCVDREKDPINRQIPPNHLSSAHNYGLGLALTHLICVALWLSQPARGGGQIHLKSKWAFHVEHTNVICRYRCQTKSKIIL